MKILLLITFLLISVYAPACDCSPMNREHSKWLMETADLIVLGTALENVHHHDSIRQQRDQTSNGVQIKLKVDKVIKGELSSEIVYVNQFSNHNCSYVFELGKQYVILGTQIQDFMNRSPFSEKDVNKDAIPVTVQEPPPPAIGSQDAKKLMVYNIEEESVNFWKKILTGNTVVHTNKCSVFEAGSVSGNYFTK